VIFSRNRGSGRHQKAEQTGTTRTSTPGEPGEGSSPDTAARTRTGGPYDVADAPAGVERLDLGSVQIPAIAGVEVRVQTGPDGQVQQVVLVSGPNALQLGAFAAPRSEGIWDEVREEIRTQLAGEAVTVEETEGRYGAELRARVRTPEGFAELRFVGVDGPRWLVRAVYQGPAAADASQAGLLAECLGGLVVDRGFEAMPAREPLPLRIPSQMAGALPADAGGDAGVGANGAAPGNQIRPMQPGPMQPGPMRQGSDRPGPPQPGSTQPGSAQPGSTQPGSAQPGSAQPGSAQPGSGGATDAPDGRAEASGGRRKPSPRPRRRG
jgi:hypothetical protein